MFNHFYCAKVGLYFGTSSPRDRMVKGHRSHQDDDDACDHVHVKFCEMPRPLPAIAIDHNKFSLQHLATEIDSRRCSLNQVRPTARESFPLGLVCMKLSK